MHRLNSANEAGIRIPIATQLILSSVLIIILTTAIFTIAGIQLIGNRIVKEAQEMVRHNLNAAREIYTSKINHINDVVRLTAGRYTLIDAVISGNVEEAADELMRIRDNEGLDILTVMDAAGNVLFRTNNLGANGDNQAHNNLVAEVLRTKMPVTATMIVASEDLGEESTLLAEQAYFVFTDTPMARPRGETEEKDGMMLAAAAPIYDYQNRFIGVMYGGTLLNRNFEIVDKIKQTVFEGLTYKGKDIGTATIFQDDVRISTNVINEDGSRAVGTRVAEEVYNQVVVNGVPWTGRAYVVNNWYITAYEPIRGINNQIIGILYVGILEQKYVDIRKQTAITFLTLATLLALVSILLSVLLSNRISVPINKLVHASREVASGNLNAEVEITSHDELGELSRTFNAMASALKERDEKLKEYTRSKIMESGRLALIGQLSANIAHELNNPLQGIVTYSHLLLEEMDCQEEAKGSIQKIVIQANRCRDIIRGLLDFSRQRKPDKTLCDINNVLNGCVSLLENQAIFQNIQIKMDLEENLPRAVIDPSQIERVFINIIINAADAIESSGQLDMATHFDKEDRCIEVVFSDTGPGIAKENIEKIFDPFFTTKDTGHGVGLGLAISYGIVKEHKGTISVESELGKGTTFVVRLPVEIDEGPENGK